MSSEPTAVKSASYYLIAVIVQRSMSILLLPLYTRYLTRADYGTLELLDLVWTLASLLVAIQLSTSLFYYYRLAQTETERRSQVVTAYLGSVVLGMGVAVAGLICAPLIDRLVFASSTHTELIQLVLLGLGFNLPAEFGLSCLKLHNWARAFAAVSVIRVLSNVVLNCFFLVILDLGVATMPWSSLITTAMLALLASWTILKSNPASYFDGPTLRKMLRYGLPLGFCAAGDVCLHFGDRIFLSRSVSLADIGIYGLSYKLGMVVPFATTPFSNYWNSQMFGIVRRPDGRLVYARAATYFLMILTFASLILTLFIRPILHLLVEPNFRTAAQFVPWIALAYLVRGMGSQWANTFLLVNRPGLVALVTWSGSATCLGAYALLIPTYGLWGAIVATHTGFAMMAFWAFLLSQRLYPIQFEYLRWAKLLASGAIAIVPTLAIHPDPFSLQLVLGSCCVGLFLIALWFLGFPTDQELAYLRGILLRLGSSRISLPMLSRPTSKSATVSLAVAPDEAEL